LAKGAAAVATAKLVLSTEKKTDDGEADSGQVADDQALDLVILEGMPDDPDEAMAWMVGLAGQDEDAPGDQLVSVKADEGEPPSIDIPDDAVLAKNKDFDAARAALIAGNLGAASEQYRKLLDEGQGGPALIGELEAAVAEQPEEPELVQLLGDAYMQDGQMQKALKTYRKGFDHL
jgi:tetratricopeptide (TPR) repeat protein